MSTFDGRVREYPTILIDKYRSNQGDIRIVLLSHCHTDHLVGFDNLAFNVPLYCSEETAAILGNLGQGKYEHLKRWLRPLPMEETTQIYIGHNQTITLTLFPANHCPGSTMFLIEGPNGNVLYTGDLRAETWFLEGIKEYRQQGKIPRLESVYLDTTFCDTGYETFPSKQESVEAIADIIRMYPATTNFKIGLNILGAENIWAALFQVFQTKVYISPTRYAIYAGLPSLPEYITDDPLSTRFHACDNCPQCVKWKAEKTIVFIRPSAMWFKGRTTEVVVKGGERFWNVLYATHSSLSELQSLISILRPRKIFPCVLTKEHAACKTAKDFFKHLVSNEDEGGSYVTGNWNRLLQTDSQETEIVSCGEEEMTEGGSPMMQMTKTLCGRAGRGVSAVVPPLYIISDDPKRSLSVSSVDLISDFVAQLCTVLAASSGLQVPPFVQLRSKGDDTLSFYSQVVTKVPSEDRARLLINVSDPEVLPESAHLCKETGAGGLHLSGTVLKICQSLDGLPFTNLVIGASCHDTADLKRAAQLGLRFVVLSPVLPSSTCPSSRTLGWDRFAQIITEAETSSLPVYALGGVSIKDLDRAHKAGGVGIAAIKAFWHDLQFESSLGTTHTLEQTAESPKSPIPASPPTLDNVININTPPVDTTLHTSQEHSLNPIVVLPSTPPRNATTPLNLLSHSKPPSPIIISSPPKRHSDSSESQSCTNSSVCWIPVRKRRRAEGIRRTVTSVIVIEDECDTTLPSIKRVRSWCEVIDLT
ncbi:uncharacterized protein SPPG_09270 [Spizellomyces punctatus DAOM BR117]|uniref:Protein artemis n=1 Tax=Spizellomyces punctatus (strain DAOM BR117) TaxID=645134 RepID=A0A0L0HGB4_SPIPD|nr:uncharacterized protein SPPG_09270 [Spizellomyces punctatus DAOM BR117]KNC99949.1 hypothetical protein SPPG_09270 [Spizellomyces punctatus DAOM BR117]|eukprot:XP_016607989.1 hypothetical protein SPPG_09270 [Spizellomyces punctatus DAOM BR117]